MATPWIESVKNHQQLSVFAGTSIMAGIWRAPFLAAIQEFNKLSGSLKLGVTFALTVNPPDPNGGFGGADVQFEAVNGAFSFPLVGVQASGTLAGKATAGLTKQLKTTFNQGSGTAATPVTRLVKALIAVPAAPFSNNANRVLGDPVKRCIAFHELIHACGLQNSDHDLTDIFFGSPQLRDGATPNADQVEADNGKRMPPIVIGPRTAATIRSLWV